MPVYVLEARTISGQYLVTLPHSNLQGEMFRNKPCALRFNLPSRHPSVTPTTVMPGKTEVWLWRDGVRIFTGPLWDVTVSSKEKSMNCSAEDVSSYLGKRRLTTDLTMTAASRSSVVWQIISASQAETNGALGIILGTLGSNGGLVDFNMLAIEGKLIPKIIEDLLEDPLAFDWDIDALRRFNTYPRSIVPSRAQLEFGGSITAYSVQAMGKWESNDAYTKGKDSARSWAVDTAKRAEYGLRQVVFSQNDIKTQDSLDLYTQFELNRRRDTRFIPHVTCRSDLANPFNGDITVGQTAKVIIDDGWAQVNQQMICGGFQFTVGKNNNEVFNLYMYDLRETT